MTWSRETKVKAIPDEWYAKLVAQAKRQASRNMYTWALSLSFYLALLAAWREDKRNEKRRR